MKLVEKSKDVPVPRGRMVSAQEIATELYHGKVTAKWVLTHVPNKMKFGHKTVLWYSDDVVAYIESVRAA